MTEPTDIVTLSEWIARDKPHRDRCIPAQFFIDAAKGSSCYTIQDNDGPVIFVRQEVVGTMTRLHTQFPSGFGMRKRVANALAEAHPLVREDAKERGFKSIRFETESLALIRFMWKFDFRADLIQDL